MATNGITVEQILQKIWIMIEILREWNGNLFSNLTVAGALYHNEVYSLQEILLGRL